MKTQMKRWLMSLVGASIFLLPLTATAVANTTTSCHPDSTHGPQAVACVITVTNQGMTIGAARLKVSGNATPGATYTAGTPGGYDCGAQYDGHYPPTALVCMKFGSVAPSQSASLAVFVNVPQGGAFSLCGVPENMTGAPEGAQGCHSMVIPGPAACLPGQTDTRVPGYCCDGNQGAVSFTCWKKGSDRNLGPNLAR